MKVRCLAVPLFAPMLWLTGCADSCGGGATSAPVASASATAGPTVPVSAAPSAPAAAGTGLDAKDNDPDVVAAVKKVIASCGAGFKPETGFEAACEPYKAFNDLKPEPGSKDATFVNLLDDKDEKVRNLGARGLAAWGSTFKADKALAERVVAAAEREKSEGAEGVVGYAAGMVDVTATGLGDRVKALLLKKDAPELTRRGVAASLVPSNRECGPCIDATREVAEKGDTSLLRTTALNALAAVPEANSKDTCKTWAAAVDGADDIVAAAVAARLTGGVTWVIFSTNGWYSTSDYGAGTNKCADQVDTVLDAAEKRAKDGKITDDNWVAALRGVLRPEFKASGKQKDKAISVAKAIVSGKLNSPAVRASALKFVADKDSGGKGFAHKFDNDADPMVAEAAKSVK